MNLFSRIAFPLAVTVFTATGVMGIPGQVRDASSRTLIRHLNVLEGIQAAPDTVVYPVGGYKLRRTLSLEEITVRDSSAADEPLDSMAVALPDSVAHISPRDSLKALLDSTMWDKLDSIYLADSTARARAAFEAWYAGLTRQERRAYDLEQKAQQKLARMDSLRFLKEERKNYRDSIADTTPRILETYALPDSLQYKRLVAWTLDTDFGKLKPYIPDTTYNYHFHDYPFRRKDVNASWLGVAGSPVQYYNWFQRRSDEGVEFYDALEPWSFSHRTIPEYNTKVPYTELGYFGTLFAGEKESDNLHIFTTQNILPELNLSLLYDRYGGRGILESEETINKTTAVQANYLGKRYSAHVGYIRNSVSRQENGGIVDVSWIRDTTVEARDISVALSGAKSKVIKNTVYLDQQLRIPFTFINKLRARRDSTYRISADSLDRDITTAFIGHSSEFSTYTRKYTDNISPGSAGADFYNDVFRYGNASADSMRVMKLDNKVYIRLQPWSSQGVVSKLDIGVGDYLKHYFDSTTVRPTRHVENSFYLYAGAEGQLRGNAFWNAKAQYVLLGYDFGDFGIEANAEFRFYPFRRARKSPISISAHFETTLEKPTWYQQHLNLNHFSWDNDFGKISTTRVQGRLDIPYWKLSADVGYALLGNNLYYDTKGIIRQNDKAMSVLSASLRKEFVLGPLHLDNRVLFQVSSNPQVLPLPAVSVNLRYFFEFVVQRNEQRQNVMVMQIGADAYCNTRWYTPAWNPDMGVFHNQDQITYRNGPFFDVFVNVQWKRACVFIKYQNAGAGWPMRQFDYFSADRYTVTGTGLSGLKIGVFWPFYTQPTGRPRR